MKQILKYQNAGKMHFQTTGLPWQQSKSDQEVSRNAQSLGILDPTTLKTRLKPAAKNLRTKYNKLSTTKRLALAKKSMPHSEIVTVKDQNGNDVTDTNVQAGAMSGADPIGEFVVGTVGGNFGFGLGKLALSKMGQNSLSHWARNSLLNEAAGNLTKSVVAPSSTQVIPTEILQSTPNNSMKPGGLTSLKFFERPSKLTEAEKLGITKADRNNINFNKSLQTQHTFTKPYLNNLGEYDFSTDVVNNPIFGKYLGDGSEQIAYENASSPGKVLKIYNDIGHSSYSSLRNFVNQYQKRNNIPYQLPTSFEGFVTNNNKMYPVFSQQYAPPISDTEFSDAINSIRTQLRGYTEPTSQVFEHQGRQILDLQPANISKLGNKYYFIDAFQSGFRKGGKLYKNNNL